MIEVKIIADSVAPSGHRLTTFVLTYPRFIHAEFMTHRVFSRNASSSRAIPVKKSIEMVMANPVIPLAFTKNQKGMQGGEALDGESERLAKEVWMQACFHACDKAKMLSDLEVHKQYANRLLEPFSHITVVVSSTDWANFFALRSHEAAQPEIHLLSDKIKEAYEDSIPRALEAGQWHLPFVTDEDWDLDAISLGTLLIKRSVARCARVSYLNHDGSNTTLEQDEALYNRLLGSQPIHASPAEHQAMAVGDPNVKSGNFRGWVQYRKTLRGESGENLNGSEG